MIVGILKSLMFMVLLYIVVRFISYIIKFLYFFKKRSFYSQEADKVNDTESLSSLNMLQCEKCKIYISKSEAYLYKGKVFCKKEHSV